MYAIKSTAIGWYLTETYTWTETLDHAAKFDDADQAAEWAEGRLAHGESTPVVICDIS